MAMTPGKPVKESTARAGIGFVFGLCAFIAVIAFYPHLLLPATLAGFAGAVLGYFAGALPYHVKHWPGA